MEELLFTATQIAEMQQQIWVNKLSVTSVASLYNTDEQSVIDAISKQPIKQNVPTQLTELDIDRIIEMGWEDRTPFDAIKIQFGISEAEVIILMRQHMKPSSFRMWRKRVTNRITKHSAKHAGEGTRFRCSLQKQITHNKISKR
jgi:uncharacterized protein (TIGR03643 family)